MPTHPTTAQTARISTSLRSLLAIAVAQLAATAVAAQDEARAEGADASLETVVVTATRMPTDGSLLPLAWSAIDSETVAFTSLQHSNQLLNRSAGAWISRGNGQESLISLRSPVLTGAGSCGAFTTAADGIPLRAPGFCNVNQLFDANLAQAGGVEVIRGPATAVYGSNAMHGVINVLSASADTTTNAVRVEAGSRDFYRVLAGVAMPDTGTAINVQVSRYGGYQDASGYDQQKFTLRHDDTIGNWRMTAVLDGSNLNQETAGYIQGDEVYKDDRIRTDNPNPEAYRDAWSVRGHVSAERDLDNGMTLRLTPYFRNNEMEFLQHFVPWQPVERNGHESIGLQSSVSASHGNLDWQVGGDLDYTQGWLEEIQAEPFSPNQPAGVHYDYEVDALVVAAFAQGRWQLNEQWQLDTGIRLEQTEYRYDNLTGTGDACEPTASACRFYRPADRDDDFADWTGNLALTRDFGPARAYVRLARGFRAPQTSELYRLQAGQQVADIDSETIDSLELGLRGQLGQGFSYSVNAYWMDKTNVIFQDTERQNVSGAETEHKGVELEFNWQINTEWYAALAATAARHRYASDDNILGAVGDIEGNDIDTAPRHFGSARIGTDQVIGIHPIRAELEWVWIDEYFVDPANQHSYAGHDLLNLRIDWTINAKLSANLVATNITDEAYAERADFGFGNFRYFVGEPRSAVFGLTWQLD